MVISPFFGHHGHDGEQRVLENLIIESIQIYGNEMYYIPRVLNDYDEVYKEDNVSTYERAIPIELYIKDPGRGFQGDRDFVSQFGVELRDQIILVVSRRRFDEEIKPITSQTRPNEGDLIYFPYNKRLFQIKYVEKYRMLYPLGSLYVWDMTVEIFEYSSEKFSTGIPEIDKLQSDFSLDVLDWSIRTEDGLSIMTETDLYLTIEGKDVQDIVPYEISDTLQKESDAIKDWDSSDPWSGGHFIIIPFLINIPGFESNLGDLIWKNMDLFTSGLIESISAIISAVIGA